MTSVTSCPICCGTEFHLVCRDLPELRFGLRERFALQRCRRCGTIVTDPVPGETYLADLYERHYVPAEFVPPDASAISLHVSAIRGGDPAILRQWAHERSTEIPTVFYQPTTAGLFAQCQSVLDVGAYTGENMLWLAAGDWTVTGVEPNPTAARVAQGLGLDVRTAYLPECHFASDSFDVAYLSYVIEHVAEPRATLLELRRVLRPGGRLVLTTHNIRSLWRYVFGRYWINWHTPFHLFHSHPSSLAYLASRAGFRPLWMETRTPMYWLMFSIRALRDGVRYGQPHKRLYDPIGPQTAQRLDRMLRLEEACGQGDCTIAVFERI
jgi:SAM-dependent methyltransferase